METILCLVICREIGRLTWQVSVYSAEIAEANDSPAVGMIFVAIRDNPPISYMSIDLTSEDIGHGVEIETVE